MGVRHWLHVEKVVLYRSKLELLCTGSSIYPQSESEYEPE